MYLFSGTAIWTTLRSLHGDFRPFQNVLCCFLLTWGDPSTRMSSKLAHYFHVSWNLDVTPFIGSAVYSNWEQNELAAEASGPGVHGADLEEEWVRGAREERARLKTPTQ